MRRLAVAALLLLLPARALADDVDLQQFKPEPGASDLFAVQSPRMPDAHVWSFLLAWHYANDPFKLYDKASGKVVGSVVGHQTAIDAGFAYTAIDRLEVGLAVPVMINQAKGGADALDPRLPSKLAASGLGDVRLLAKYRLAAGDRWTLAAALPLSLPTGNGTFLGHDGITARPRALADFEPGLGMTATSELGLVLRPAQRFLNFEQASAIDYGVGVEKPFEARWQQFSAMATLGGEWGLASSAVESRPVELLAGLKWRSRGGVTVTVGGGPGLSKGAGTPDYRVFLLVGRTVPPYHPQGMIEPSNADLVSIDREKMALTTIEPVYFGTDDDLIAKRSYAELERVAQVLVANPWIKKVRVEGHTDNHGGEAYNLNLSQLRAISVAKFLVDHGVDPDVLEAKGFGLSKPVASNDTEEGRAQNRRVEFIITDVDPDTAPAWAKQWKSGQTTAPVPTPSPTATPAPK